MSGLWIRCRRVGCAFALATAVAVLAAVPAAAAETWVSFSAVLAQVKSGPLIRAIINPQRGDVEIKFRNLNEWHAFYPPADQAELQRLLDARHVRVLFVPRHQAAAVRPAAGAVHHPLRDGLILALAAVAASAGVYLLWRRRARRRQASAHTG